MARHWTGRNTVTRGNWNVGTTSPRYDANNNVLPGVTLSVFKIRNGKFQYGDGEGRVFETSKLAYAWAHEHGYLQSFVHSWCRHCRVLHTFMGKPSGFCDVLKEFC